MTGAALVPTGIVTVCCGSHRGLACCDPDDCGPCCPECPTCPTLMGYSPFVVKMMRRIVERTAILTDVHMRYGEPLASVIADRLDRESWPPPQVVEPPVALLSLLVGTPLPWQKGGRAE